MKGLRLPAALGAALLACGHAAAEGQPARLGLKLSPASLGASISLQQHLHVEREDRTNDLDVALEVDEDHLTMVGLALGQRVMSLEYDGTKVTSWRHFLLPSQVRSEDVLEDIQLTYWPAEAIRTALPSGWRIEDEDGRRTLWSGDDVVMSISYSGQPRWNGKVLLDNLRYRYRIAIESAPMGQ